MGAVPSREAPRPLYSLRYGSHELGLIPFTRAYITSGCTALREQIIRLRNDPGVRYNQMRPGGVPLNELPLPTYTEKDLEAGLDAVEASLFDTNEEMLQAFEREAGPGGPLHHRSSASETEKQAALLRVKRATRPVPCVIIFVYMKSRDDLECFHFDGRLVNVIGFVTSRVFEGVEDDRVPYLKLHKAMLKAAGDRTIERVLTLAATLFHEQMTRILTDHRPQQPCHTAIHDRLEKLSLQMECMWNNYPILKLLFDTLALLHSTPEVRVLESPPKIRIIPPEASDKGQLVEMVIDGNLLARIWFFMAVHLLRTTNRSNWVQFSLANENSKTKRVMEWMISTTTAQHFFHDHAMTTLVRNHLHDLHQEIVAARKVDQSDLTAWSEMQERSRDNKVYRIFYSSRCGPFLTTVKQPKDHPRDTASLTSSNKAKDDEVQRSDSFTTLLSSSVSLLNDLGQSERSLDSAIQTTPQTHSPQRCQSLASGEAAVPEGLHAKRTFLSGSRSGKGGVVLRSGRNRHANPIPLHPSHGNPPFYQLPPFGGMPNSVPLQSSAANLTPGIALPPSYTGSGSGASPQGPTLFTMPNGPVLMAPQGSFTGTTSSHPPQAPVFLPTTQSGMTPYFTAPPSAAESLQPSNALSASMNGMPPQALPAAAPIQYILVHPNGSSISVVQPTPTAPLPPAAAIAGFPSTPTNVPPYPSGAVPFANPNAYVMNPAVSLENKPLDHCAAAVPSFYAPAGEGHTIPRSAAPGPVYFSVAASSAATQQVHPATTSDPYSNFVYMVGPPSQQAFALKGIPPPA